MLNWVITGGAGFIGKNLIEQLLCDPNNKIRVVDNLSQQESIKYIRWPYQLLTTDNHLTWQSEQVELIKADILDRNFAFKACEGADIIVHLAANTGVEPSIKNPEFDCKTNVLGTLNYLESARHNGVNKFIFASSGAPAGNAAPPIQENVVPRPLSPYGASKLAGEGYCSAFYHSFGIETVALRFSNVYGPLSKHKSSVIAQFLKQIMKQEQLTIYGDGTQTRDFIFVTDLIHAIISAATTNNIGGELFQVATGQETSINELIRVINFALQEYNIEPAEFEFLPARIGDMKRNYADISKISSKLNWSPKVDLKNGLAQTLAWFNACKSLQAEHV